MLAELPNPQELPAQAKVMLVPVLDRVQAEPARRCPTLATSAGSGHVAGTTALPLRADLRAATSAFLAWRSALPRIADAAGRGLPGPVMTLSGN